MTGNIENALEDGNAPLMRELLQRITYDLDNRIYGKLESGENPVEERALRKEIQEIRRELNENS